MNRTPFQLSKHVCIFKILWLCQELSIFPLGHIERNFDFLLLPTLVDTMMRYDSNQLTMNNTVNDNGNNQPMFPSDNLVSKVKNGSKVKNEAFADTLEWCRRASELENCPRLLGDVALNAATTCTCLHDLLPHLDGQ